MVIALTIAVWIFRIAYLIAFAVQLWAFVDCLMARSADFSRAGKRPKIFWLALTGASALVGLIFVVVSWQDFGGGSGTFLVAAGCVAAGVYLADVRPALQAFRGGGSASDPYRSW